MVQESSIKPLSERERKLITSLRLAKMRDEEQLFVAEGCKTIETLLPFFTLRLMVASSAELLGTAGSCARLVSSEGLKKLSLLESRRELLALFEIPKQPTFVASSLTVALDEVQNPGNLGTIIRLCDWLGVKNILCGKGCADPYNPKVVQATMGALGGVHIYRDIDLASFLPQHFDTIVATTMQGQDYRSATLPQGAVLLFGNEGSGISQQVLQLATHCITIPRAEGAISDSLNVSMSAAILLSSFLK